MKSHWNDRWSAYFFVAYLLFLSGFFILPTRLHRDCFYFFILLPFVFYLPRVPLREVFQSRILVLSLLYVFYTALSSLWSAMGAAQVADAFRQAIILGGFLLVSAHFLREWETEMPSFFILLCSFAGIAAAATVLWYYLLQPEDPPLLARLVGPEQIDHPNKGATVFSMIVLICHFGFLSRSEISKKVKLWVFAIAATSLVYILLTQSRGPLLAFVAAMGMGAILIRDKKIFLLGSLLGGGFLVLLLAGIYNPLERSDSFRMEIWKTSFELFSQRPISGFGVHSLKIPVSFGGTINHAHNIFINTALESGVLGLTLLVLPLGCALREGLIQFRKKGDVLLLVLLVFSLLAALTDGGSLLRSPHYEWLQVWFPLGLAIGYERIRKKAEHGIPVAGSQNQKERSFVPLKETCDGSIP